MQTETNLSVGADTTLTSHRHAVERVILEMRAHLADPFSLSEMARIACLSPFHFDRIFHQTTGIPAVQFLYALRIEAAKRLLLTSSLSVTDICYEVGYNSIGTFTSRFTELVGLSPRRFRQLGEKVDTVLLWSLLAEAPEIFKNASPGSSMTGRILTPKPIESIIFVGLFPSQIPQSRPVAGTLLTSPGFFSIGLPPAGQFYVFAAAFPRTRDPLTYLLPEAASLLVGVGKRVVNAGKEEPGDSIDVILRPLCITDPPILIALPFLLVEVLATDHARAV